MAIQTGRLLTMHAAWKLDQGDFARKEVSMAKVVVANTLQQSVDTAIQLCGARGYSKDTRLEWIYRRSEEHTSELQSLMRISYAVFCLKKKKPKHYTRPNTHTQTAHITTLLPTHTHLHTHTTKHT